MNHTQPELHIEEEGGIKLTLPTVIRIDGVPRRSEPVFYNPKQIFNRDFSLVCFKAYDSLENKPLAVYDLLAASGVRGIRYAKESLNTHKLIFNDTNPLAKRLIDQNIALNAPALNHVSNIIVNWKDAVTSLMESTDYYDVIDVDPFGSPARFLYPTVKALAKDGLLCVTATDMPVLTGVYPLKTFKQYGVTHIIKSLTFCHEIALRILIAAIQRVAFLQGNAGFMPLLSFSADHYIRVFLKKSRSKPESLTKQGFIALCMNCDERMSLPLNHTPGCCPSCGNYMQLIGPLYLGLLNDSAFVSQCQLEFSKLVPRLATAKRIDKYLRLLADEALIDVPWHHCLHATCKNNTNYSSPPTIEFYQFLKAKAIPVALTAFSPTAIKTTLSTSELLQEIGNYFLEADRHG